MEIERVGKKGVVCTVNCNHPSWLILPQPSAGPTSIPARAGEPCIVFDAYKCGPRTAARAPGTYPLRSPLHTAPHRSAPQRTALSRIYIALSNKEPESVTSLILEINK